MAVGRMNSKLTNLDVGRGEPDLFKELLSTVPRDKALDGRGAQERRSVLKDHLLQCILTKRKAGRSSRRPGWMNKELLAKLKIKRKRAEGGSKDG